jgi:hypothetical protein
MELHLHSHTHLRGVVRSKHQMVVNPSLQKPSLDTALRQFHPPYILKASLRVSFNFLKVSGNYIYHML